VKKWRNKSVCLLMILIVSLSVMSGCNELQSHESAEKMVLNDELMLRSLATDQEGQEFTISVDNPPVSNEQISSPQVSLSIPQIASQTVNTVVEIATEKVTSGDRIRQYISEGAGSGVIISSDGYIVTNNHVIDIGYGYKIDYFHSAHSAQSSDKSKHHTYEYGEKCNF
jgi:S1-C subfamily serine protease